jgi:hypothetical protein
VRKLLLLLSVLFVVSCSSGTEEAEIREKKIQEISLTVIQNWSNKRTINRQALLEVKYDCGQLRNGLSGGDRNHWFSVDTLEIDFRWDFDDQKYNIDLNIQNPSNSEALTHYRYIGYIKLLNHVDGKTVSFNKSYLENTWDKKMIYFDSNVSEESIKSIFLQAENTGGCHGSITNTGLVKSTTALSTVKATSTEIIAYNPENDKIKVGDIWGRYIVLDKKYLWY